MSVPAVLPLVTGQHRNRALAAARQARAVELATQGLTYQAIADELGYAHKGTVYRMVHQALARNRREAVEGLQELEVARLDAVQHALWDKAMGGDVGAGQVIIQIIQARCRLLSLDLRTAPAAATPRTVVLRKEEREALGL
ncbi:helix-turn-helix domain-containing protein [Humibacillus xanthopallidus]|nr:hypothetical protein [Humibacillus xanthopallidus]